jgi:hypothetical protein
MADDDKDDISPTVDFLKSLRAETVDYPLLFGEAVDNALDVKATYIEILIGRDRISISDNGLGVLPGHYTAIFQLGRHEQRRGGRTVGRYGQGIKVQAIRAGTGLSFWTQNEHEQVRNGINWEELIRRRSWKIQKPIVTPANPDLHTGTVIVITKLDKTPNDKDVAKTTLEIERMFYPALEHCAILMNGKRIEPVAEPAMTDIIEAYVEAAKGKGARIRAGMLKIAGGWLSQVHLVYKHRVLRSQCLFGCGDYSGTTAMFCRIDLDDNWGLRPFKNGLKDIDEGNLSDLVEDVLRPLLEQCEAASIDAVADEMADVLTADLPSEMRPMRPRKKGEKRGIGKKRGKSGETKEGDSSDTGPARSKRQPYLRIEFLQGLHGDHGIGKFEYDRRLSRIQLARDNPYIAYWLKHGDLEAKLMALRLPALMLYLHYKEVKQTDIESYGIRVWRLLERQPKIKSVAA